MTIEFGRPWLADTVFTLLECPKIQHFSLPYKSHKNRVGAFVAGSQILRYILHYLITVTGQRAHILVRMFTWNGFKITEFPLSNDTANNAELSNSDTAVDTVSVTFSAFSTSSAQSIVSNSVISVFSTFWHLSLNLKSMETGRALESGWMHVTKAPPLIPVTHTVPSLAEDANTDFWKCKI